MRPAKHGLCALALCVLLGGCVGEPTDRAARAAFDAELRQHVAKAAQIRDFSKTGGRLSDENRVFMYAYDFDAQVALPEQNPAGERYRGTVTFVHGSRGWRAARVVATAASGDLRLASAGAQIDGTRRALFRLRSALMLYELDNGTYPSTAQGLEALLAKPSTAPVPEHYREGAYLDALPRDAWERELRYQSPTPRAAYELKSLGADARAGGRGADADLVLTEYGF